VTESAVARWRALGTTAAVVVEDAAALDAARRAVVSELEAIDRAASRFRADSELVRVNDRAGRWTSVGPLLAEAVAAALRAAELTDGAVDPTVGAALVLAGYDRDFAAGLREPDAVGFRRVSGWRTVALDPARGRVRVARGTRLDLGATAKALAADRAARTAAGACGTGVLVNLGGDIAIAGAAPEGGWPVHVTDDHRAGPAAPGQIVVLRAGGLATSSTTVRRWGAGSHHLIDPRTGRPALSRWRTVSVAAASCVDANIASTASIVRGEDAPSWLAGCGLPARLVDHDGRVEALAGWPVEAAA
jgi:thiamine biosynthesis lipoprotein